MRSLLAIAVLVACSEAWAQVTLPHDLQPNTKASASKVMENFNALKQDVEVNASAIDALPTPPNNCNTDQIIKWNGSAWVCSDRLLITKTCDELSACEQYCPDGTYATGGGCGADGFGTGPIPVSSSFTIDATGFYCVTGRAEDGDSILLHVVCPRGTYGQSDRLIWREYSPES